MKDAEDYLRKTGIRQYWTRPKSPKEKPFVEQLIGTLQKECLDYHDEPMKVAELRDIVNKWLDQYHCYRPHESLDTGGIVLHAGGVHSPCSRHVGEVSYRY